MTTDDSHIELKPTEPSRPESVNLDELFLVAQPVVPLDCRDQPAYYEFLLRVRDDEGVARTPDELSDPCLLYTSDAADE